jgi:hypothetical protein
METPTVRRLILSLERLDRIRAVLDRRGGTASLRDLQRSHGIWTWEIEQAEALGWLTIRMHKPRVGRPSLVAEVSREENAKLPPPRYEVEGAISTRHYQFALRSVGTVHRGMQSIGFPPIVSAYVAIYNPRSRQGASASASRLLRRPDVQAARQWFYAMIQGEIPTHERMPETASGIWERLRTLQD